MKGEPVGRPRSHAGQARELGDEVFHSRAEHSPYCADMPRIAEVALFTDDVQALAAFYERLLGRPPDSSSVSHASFDLAGTTLFIHVAGEEGPEGAPNVDHVAFALDQESAAERARSEGVEVFGPEDFYWGRSAYLRDLDGRVVELQSES
jgi:catechol-2,3-dioxygenase